jgi:hypothetical protein
MTAHITNTESEKKQVRPARNLQTWRRFHSRLILVGFKPRGFAHAIGLTTSNSLVWAFSRGKSPRAAEIRALALAALVALESGNAIPPVLPRKQEAA